MKIYTVVNRSALSFLLLPAILMAILTGCNKDEDYRDKYTGKWNFTTYKMTFMLGEPSTYDTVYYTGEISKASADNEISIQYTSEDVVTLVVSDTGALSAFPTRYSGGWFKSNREVWLYLRWGGLGGGTIHDVTGTR